MMQFTELEEEGFINFFFFEIHHSNYVKSLTLCLNCNNIE